MLILGLTTGIHDTCAALVKDGKILSASSEERFDRIKHSGKFPRNAIAFCLKYAAIQDINEVNKIVIGMDWMERGKARFELRFSKENPEQTVKAANQAIADFNRAIEVESILRKEFKFNGKIEFLDHYNSHASACYFSSPFMSSAIIIVDGAGERASARIYHAKGTKLTTVLQIDYPNSIGRFYGWITDYLGFKIDCDEGKTMGLAPYGTNKLIPKMREVLQIKKDGTYSLNFDYFDFIRDNQKGVSQKFIDTFGPKREKNEEITQHHKDIAKAAQVVLEDAIISLAIVAKKLTKEDNLCISGGVALNSVANGRILKEKIFKNIFVYPASGDDGTGIGAGLYTYFSTQKNKKITPENQSPYLGYQSNELEILNAIKNNNLTYSKSSNIFKETAKLLSEDKIIGWVQDRAEIGPRALGNRSILANPKNPDNKDKVNKKIKFRESFRPFAPAVIEDFANDYFEIGSAISPYMLLTFQTRKNKMSLIPSVVHVDGSARVQTVNKSQNLKLWTLLKEFNQLTGIPVLLNTSFNRAGEVLVNTPEQAIQAFKGSDLDALVMHDYIIKKIN